jgi:murein DD-endopeptidase MepM/ murein hydrolase activator NlpD
MLQNRRSVIVALLMSGCTPMVQSDYSVIPTEEESWGAYGGGMPVLTLPFVSGEYWLVTQTYNQGSHVDYGFTYGDDSYAVDFAQAGCDAYGKPVTPVADGTVLEVGTAGSNKDHGYGNTVLIDHGGGYVSRYGHLSALYVSEGEYVSRSDVIGAVGNTGYVVGSACSDHPGTHLHLAFYKDGEGIPPELMSENTMTEGCWYNREGLKDCESDPGSYDPVEDDSEGNDSDNMSDDPNEDYELDGEGELGVAFCAVYPDSGTQEQTEFLWVAIIDSPDGTPEATLKIHNPNDNVTYEFEMEMERDRNPYVFSYQKTLRDESDDYEYWVQASNGDGNDQSSHHRMSVEDEVSDFPELGTFSMSPTVGEAGDTEFDWSAHVYSDDRPDATLHILNPNDLTVYEFDMDVDDYGDEDWKATYQKTLRDEAEYPYWYTADNGNSANASRVRMVEAE